MVSAPQKSEVGASRTGVRDDVCGLLLHDRVLFQYHVAGLHRDASADYEGHRADLRHWGRRPCERTLRRAPLWGSAVCVALVQLLHRVHALSVFCTVCVCLPCLHRKNEADFVSAPYSAFLLVFHPCGRHGQHRPSAGLSGAEGLGIHAVEHFSEGHQVLHRLREPLSRPFCRDQTGQYIELSGRAQCLLRCIRHAAGHPVSA